MSTQSAVSLPRFQQSQYRFAGHLRDPDNNPAPQGIEDRRMAIYRDLIFNNIEGFLSSGFPILRSLMTDVDWEAMVRDFIVRHQSHTPYFLEISQEFLRYLQQERQQASDPAFMAELAHYEWVELALDVNSAELPEPSPHDISAKALLQQPLWVSPVAWSLSYEFDVHRIGPNYQPVKPPEQPTWLIVNRNRDDLVGFIESNAVTARLLHLLEEAEDPLTGEAAILMLAEEMQHPEPQALLGFGGEILCTLAERDVIGIPVSPKA